MTSREAERAAASWRQIGLAVSRQHIRDHWQMISEWKDKKTGSTHAQNAQDKEVIDHEQFTEKRPVGETANDIQNNLTTILTGGIDKMKVSDAFKSNYFKVADLKGRRLLVEIEEVSFEEVGDDKKLVCYFKGQTKGLALNKTNASMIEEITGTEETDNWPGTKLILKPSKVDFQGKRVDAIRIDYKPPTPGVPDSDSAADVIAY